MASSVEKRERRELAEIKADVEQAKARTHFAESRFWGVLHSGAAQRESTDALKELAELGAKAAAERKTLEALKEELQVALDNEDPVTKRTRFEKQYEEFYATYTQDVARLREMRAKERELEAVVRECEKKLLEANKALQHQHARCFNLQCELDTAAAEARQAIQEIQAARTITHFYMDPCPTCKTGRLQLVDGACLCTGECKSVFHGAYTENCIMRHTDLHMGSRDECKLIHFCENHRGR